jgi:hypothetical protein
MNGNKLTVDAEMGKLQYESFKYFVHETNPANGLVIDKTAADWPASIAASGLGLACYPVAVERGFMSRAAAVERTLATLRLFRCLTASRCHSSPSPEKKRVGNIRGVTAQTRPLPEYRQEDADIPAARRAARRSVADHLALGHGLPRRRREGIVDADVQTWRTGKSNWLPRSSAC